MALDLRHTFTVETRYGPIICPRGDVYVSQCLLVYGEYCQGEIELCYRILKPGAQVIEVGSNFGALTVPLAQSYDVYAFEPQPFMFDILEANIGDGGIVTKEGLSDKPGTGYMDLEDPSTIANYGGTGLKHAGTEIRLNTLDAFLAYHKEPIGLIKLDVEGHELEVLKGASGTIQKDKPYLYFENDRFDKAWGLIDHVKSLGYQVYWHFVPFYNPNNWRGAPNGTGKLAALNCLGVPERSPSPLPDRYLVGEARLATAPLWNWDWA